jgi:hypothetical protein
MKLRTIIILPVVSYGFKTLSLTIHEEYRLRVTKNKAVRRNKEGVTEF